MNNMDKKILTHLLLMSFCFALGFLTNYLLIFRESNAMIDRSNQSSVSMLSIDSVTKIEESQGLRETAEKEHSIQCVDQVKNEKKSPNMSPFEQLLELATNIPWRFNDESLQNLIANNSFVSRQEVKSFDDPIKFAKRYFEMISNNAYESSFSEDPDIYLLSWFSASPQENSAQSQFSQSTERIYLHLASAQEIESDVIVKWYKEDTGERILLKRFSINNELLEEYFWVKKDSWPIGTYNVEVYAANEELRLITASQYFIF
jgi:hypothetical protein